MKKEINISFLFLQNDLQRKRLPVIHETFGA